ncbi:MAG: hypothetical protein CVU81_03130, partial [Euryarchaeota archaeon HGW-Euryarchaeota-1]
MRKFKTDNMANETNTDIRKNISREIIEKILSGRIISKDALEREKSDYCEKFGIAEYLNNPEILQCAEPDEKGEILKIL